MCTHNIHVGLHEKIKKTQHFLVEKKKKSLIWTFENIDNVHVHIPELLLLKKII